MQVNSQQQLFTLFGFELVNRKQQSEEVKTWKRQGIPQVLGDRVSVSVEY